MASRSPRNRTSEEVKPSTEFVDADYKVDVGFEGEGVTGFTKELKWQDIYTNEAKKTDQELINNWKESLNNLLLFAAIFAAVLTAFIIESKQMLEEDPASQMLEVMIFYTNHRSNDTRSAYEKPVFQPTAAAVSINCLFFASLGGSLVAALASVVALQWVANYDAAITPGGESTLHRVNRRQFRFAGIQKWKMKKVIDGLPILIFIGVLLFFAGLMQWMLEINRTVGYVVVGGAIIAVIFYFSSAIVAVVDGAAPFRTAPVRWSYSSILFLLRLIYWSIQSPSLTRISEWISNHFPAVDDNSSERDDRLIRAGEDELQYKAYLWVSQHINISQDSYRRWILLMAEIPGWIEKKLGTTEFIKEPWISNLSEIARYYYTNTHLPYTTEDTKCVSVLVRSFNVPEIRSCIVERNPCYQKDRSKAEYWSRDCLPATGSFGNQVDKSYPLLLLARDLPIPHLESASEMKATIQLSKWRNSLDKEPSVWKDVLSHMDTFSTKFLSDSLDMLIHYIPHSKWGFGDKNKQDIYISLMTVLVEREKKQELSLSSTESISRTFAYLVSGEYSLEYPLRFGQKMLSFLENTKILELHVAITLMLARSLRIELNGGTKIPLGGQAGNSFASQEALLRRLKEVITMLWLVPHKSLERDLDTGPLKVKACLDWSLPDLYDGGRFYNWPERVGLLPCALEVLECMLLAQTSCNAPGAMWRVNVQDDDEDVDTSIGTFEIFDNLVSDSNPSSHFAVIESLCQRFEADRRSFGGQSISPSSQELLCKLRDPCVQFIACRALNIPYPDVLGRKKIPEGHQESLERTQAFIVKGLALYPSAVTVKLSASFWGICSPEQKRKWCHNAHNKPEKIGHIGPMRGGLILRKYQDDVLSCLWHDLLETSLAAARKRENRRGGTWGRGSSSDQNEAGDNFRLGPEWVTVKDRKIIFDGVDLQGRVLGLIARLLYIAEERHSLGFSSGLTTQYILHTWKLSDAIRARPTLMLNLLAPLFTIILDAEGLELEGAIILKLFQEFLSSRDDLSTGLLCSIIRALRDAINSDFWHWVPGFKDSDVTLDEQTTRTIDSILVTLRDRAERMRNFAEPRIRAIAWPQKLGSDPRWRMNSF